MRVLGKRSSEPDDRGRDAQSAAYGSLLWALKHEGLAFSLCAGVEDEEHTSNAALLVSWVALRILYAPYVWWAHVWPSCPVISSDVWSTALVAHAGSARTARTAAAE